MVARLSNKSSGGTRTPANGRADARENDPDHERKHDGPQAWKPTAGSARSGDRFGRGGHARVILCELP